MKALRTLLLGAMLIGIVLGPVCLVMPDTASAVEYSGTSPAFAPGTAWSLYVGWFGAGDIIEWHWTTGDALSFSLLYTVDSTTTQIWGFSSDDGYVVESAGHYGLWWYNNNWFFSATVDYWVAGFTPFTTVMAPSDGAYLNSATIVVQGLTDPYSTEVFAGPDAFHLTRASWSGDNWAAEEVILDEGQNSILVRTRYWLDSYGYKIVTYDQTLTVTIDTILPELVITSPVNDAYRRGDLAITWQCSDSNGIIKTEIKFDAWGWQEATGTSYSANLEDGYHTIQVRVTDHAGNQATRTASFTADSTPPELTIFGPTEGTTTSDKRVVFGGTDNIGISEYMIRLDSSGWQPTLAGTVYDLDLADGPHTVQVKLIDMALNEAVRTVNFTLDTELPVVTVIGPVVGADIRGGYVDVTWQCTDNLGIASIEMKIDGWDWRPVSGYEIKEVWLPSGYHVIQVRVTDNAGNQAVGSTSFNNDNRALSFSGPYYGLPTVGSILAIVIAAVLVMLMLRKRKGGPAVTTVPKEEPTPQTPP